MPDLPTVAESGVPGYESLPGAASRCLPARRAGIERLNKDLNAVLASGNAPEARRAGRRDDRRPPEAFAQHIRAEREKWSRLIREKNIVVN